MWNGGILTFSNVSDVSYNKIETARIDPANKWLSNEFDRDKAIQAFKDSISQIAASANQISLGKKQSSIYVPIANELNRLSQSKAQRRILIVYSDLMENDHWLTIALLTKSEFQQLQSNPDSLKNLFEQREPALSQLKGIQVYLIESAS